MTARVDLPHLAAVIRNAGELLEARGPHAWTTTRQWQPGPGAANLDPGRASGTIADPTGQAAVSPQPDPHADLRRRIDAAVNAAKDLVDILQRVGMPPVTRWCHWHLQIGVYEPAPLRSIDGLPASEWVYRRWLKTNTAPTTEQTRRHAEGGRIRSVA